MNIADRLRGFRSSHSELQSVIVEALIHIITNQEAMMATLQDIETAAQADLAKAQSEQNALTAITGILQSQQAKIADLTTQLNAAIANGADPATLQSISDELSQTNTALDANAAAEAALANTTPPAGTTGTQSMPTGSATAANASPVITSITPDDGAPGDTVTINGQNFVASESVTFGGVAIAPTDMDISADGTSITAKVPAGSGQVQVLVGNGVGTSNSVPFSYGASNANPNLAPQNTLSNTSPVGIGGTTANTTKDDGTEIQGTPS